MEPLRQVLCLVTISKYAVITQFDGKRALMIRAAGLWRHNPILTAQITVYIYLPTVDPLTGLRIVRGHNLKFVRQMNPMFTLPATWIHIIDEESPMYHLSADDFSQDESSSSARKMLARGCVRRFDSCLGQTVATDFRIGMSFIKWGYRFRDIISYNSHTDKIWICMSKFHDIEPFSPYARHRSKSQIEV